MFNYKISSPFPFSIITSGPFSIFNYKIRSLFQFSIMRSGPFFNFLTTSLISAGRLSHLMSVCLIFVSWGEAERGDQLQCWWSKRCTSDDVPHSRDLCCKSHCSRSESHFTSVSPNNINCGISFAAACEPHNIWAGAKRSLTASSAF